LERFKIFETKYTVYFLYFLSFLELLYYYYSVIRHLLFYFRKIGKNAKSFKKKYSKQIQFILKIAFKVKQFINLRFSGRGSERQISELGSQNVKIRQNWSFRCSFHSFLCSDQLKSHFWRCDVVVVINSKATQKPFSM
jgi:hypothetical protein